MDIKKILAVFALGVSMIPTMSAETFPVKLGVRAGLNVSNQGVNYKEIFSDVKKGESEWKAGADLGVVADVKLTDCIYLQPGFFYRIHNYKYVIASANFDGRTMGESFGKANYTDIQVPLLASYRMPVFNSMELQFDAGPYVSVGFTGSNKIEVYKSETNNSGAISMKEYKNGFYDDSDSEIVGSKKFDWGFKFGAGLLFKEHYYIGVHYSAGCNNVGKTHSSYINKASVVNKAWDISVGYNF